MFLGEVVNQINEKNKKWNIKMFYKAQEAVIKLFADYSTIASEAKHASFYGKGLKILTTK